MIFHMMICVNDISNCGQANATICLNIKDTYKLSPGHIRPLLGKLAKKVCRSH